MVSYTVLHDPRCVFMVLRGNLYYYKFSQNVLVELCSNRLTWEKWPRNIWRILLPESLLLITFGQIRDDGTTTLGLGCSPNPPVLVIEESLQWNERYMVEPNVNKIRFNSIQLLMHSVRKYLACINNSNTKWLSCQNLLWKQVEALTHNTVCWHASYSILSFKSTNGNAAITNWTTSTFPSVTAARGRKPSSLIFPVRWNFSYRAYCIPFRSLRSFLSSTLFFSEICAFFQQYSDAGGKILRE